MDEEHLLTHLECPVCILPPRSPPIYQCPTGHLVCSECQPSLVRCPICNVKFRKNLITRDFFAEKVLEHLERRCRYELFDCEFKSRSSDALVLHETVCDHKPPVPVKRKRNAQTNTDQDNANNDILDDDEEDENEVEEEEEDEDDVMLEDIFVSNFAFILVLLRAYILEFGDAMKHNHMYLEYFLLFLLCVWIYYVWQENGFALLMDETSPFIAMYFVIVVLAVVVGKTLYGDSEGNGVVVVDPGGGVDVDPGGVTVGEDDFSGVTVGKDDFPGLTVGEDDLINFLWYLKPAVTLMTGVFCSVVHVYVYDLRQESWFVLGCVLTVSFLLSGAEVIWDLASTLDQMYFVIFWLQSFFIVLPFGMIGRHFLDF